MGFDGDSHAIPWSRHARVVMHTHRCRRAGHGHPNGPVMPCDSQGPGAAGNRGRLAGLARRLQGQRTRGHAAHAYRPAKGVGAHRPMPMHEQPVSGTSDCGTSTDSPHSQGVVIDRVVDNGLRDVQVIDLRRRWVGRWQATGPMGQQVSLSVGDRAPGDANRPRPGQVRSRSGRDTAGFGGNRSGKGHLKYPLRRLRCGPLVAAGTRIVRLRGWNRSRESTPIGVSGRPGSLTYSVRFCRAIVDVPFLWMFDFTRRELTAHITSTTTTVDNC